jgi:hypothetical protein
VLIARNGKALGYVAEAKPAAAPIMARALEILAERMEPTARNETGLGPPCWKWHSGQPVGTPTTGHA